MLNYSINTVLIAIITSNILIVLMFLCFQSEKILTTVGYKLLMVFLVLTLVRFLFPFEVPGLATTIRFSESVSKIVGYIRHPFMKLFGIKITLWRVFECVWFIGSIRLLNKYLKEIRTFECGLLLTGIEVTKDEPYTSVLAKACGQRKNVFRILRVPGIVTPQIFGIRNPRILLPLNLELTEEELYYTLCHETSHYYHHDLLTKHIITFLTIFYWWNPICRKSFKRQTKILLEMRIDDSLVKGDKQVADAYMHTLLKIAEFAEKASNSSDDDTDFVLSMISVKEKDNENEKENDKKKAQENVVPRFQMMCRKKKSWHPILSFVLFTVVICVYWGSYLFVFENYYAWESDVNETYATSDDGFYAILKTNGTYDIYCYDLFIENAESLEYYPDVPVYNK